jgi:hypothetical protein
MSNLPILPAGPAWKENGWRPTLAEIQDFERIAASYGAPLVSYWSWEHCRRDVPELWPADVITPPPPPPPLPPPVEDETRLWQLEKKIQDLEEALIELTQVLSDLSALVKTYKG